MTLDNIIRDRTTSSFGLSIGTAIFMENIFGMDNNSYDNLRKYVPINIDTYKYHYINVFTLLRNIYTAVDSKSLDIVLNNQKHKNVILKVLYEEFEIINQLYNGKKCEVVYFLPDYDKVTNKTFLNVNKKISRKEQIYLNSKSLTKEISSEIEKMNVHVLEDTHKLEKTNEKIVLTTHIIPDLLNYVYVKNLVLLESHTGVIKKISEFNTKYLKSKQYDNLRLPFNEVLLRLIGDNLILEAPMVNFRKEIGSISIDNKWTPVTTETKVVIDLKKNADIRDQINVILTYSKAYRH